MNNRIRILSILVMLYMLAALSWWAILLFQKNNEIFKLQSKLLQEQYINNDGIPTVDVTTLSEFDDLKKANDRNVIMILAEAIFFGMVLILGVYLINRSFYKELSIAERKKNFLLSITHELKSPLTSINLILETLQKRRLSFETVKEFSRDALQESLRLDNLFSKILLAARLESSVHIEPIINNCSQLVFDVINKFEKQHPEAKFDTNIDENIMFIISSDDLTSIVINLLENAIKYTAGNPTIGIQLSKHNNKLCLVIADNGIGIPKKERNNIYEQFYRIGSEEHRKSKGTGLGLYIVKKIVESYKGTIQISENKRWKTIFTITI